MRPTRSTGSAELLGSLHISKAIPARLAAVAIVPHKAAASLPVAFMPVRPVTNASDRTNLSPVPSVVSGQADYGESR